MRKPLPEIECDEKLRGYARVSTDEQSVDMQVGALLRAGCCKENIYIETVSGASKRRPQRELLLRQAQPGDTVIVWKLDRWGRNVRDIYETVFDLEKRGVAFKSIRDTIDTKTPVGKVMFGILAVISEFERDLIQERIREGMQHAKAQGRKFGAKKKLTERQLAEIEKLIAKGFSLAEIGRRYHVAAGTIRNNGFRGDRLTQLRAKAGD